MLVRSVTFSSILSAIRTLPADRLKPAHELELEDEITVAGTALTLTHS